MNTDIKVTVNGKTILRCSTDVDLKGKVVEFLKKVNDICEPCKFTQFELLK